MLYKLVYYHYYRFSLIVKNNFPGSILYNTGSDAVMILSVLELMNVVTLGLYLKIEPITTTYHLDIALVFIVLLFINYLHFLRGKRYIKIIEVAQTKSSVFSLMVTILYTVASLYYFYSLHSASMG
jgi:hypothetical protein